METKIRQGFDGDDGSLYVYVHGSEEGSVMRFSFNVYRERPVTLPIALTSEDGGFQASCRAQCIVKFQFYADLELDSDLIIRDELAKGIKLDLSEYFLELTSNIDDSGAPYIEEKPHDTRPIAVKAEFKYGGASAETETASFDVEGTKKWYLQGPEPAASDADPDLSFVSYETIRDGKYRWESWDGGLVELRSSARADADEAPPNGIGLAFDYTAEDLFAAARQEKLYVFDGEWLLLETPKNNAE
jgi:hypothetical protein